MKEKPTGNSSSKRGGSDWERVRTLTDAEIRRAIKTEPDERPTDAAFWAKAKLVLPQPKQTVTVRLDADLLVWLRRQKGYQTRINAVLRTYMQAQKA